MEWIVDKLLSWSLFHVQRKISNTGLLNEFIWITTPPTVSQWAADEDKAVPVQGDYSSNILTFTGYFPQTSDDLIDFN